MKDVISCDKPVSYTHLTKEFSASAGGGAVEVTINGKKEITSIKLAEEIVDPEDIAVSYTHLDVYKRQV